MREYQMQWWKLQLPESWNVDEVHGTATIRTPYGTLQISGAMVLDDPATDEDLEAFAAEPINAGVPHIVVKCEDFHGFRMEYESKGFHHRRWFLRSEFTIACPGYWCVADNFGKDNEQVDFVINSLQRTDPKQGY